MRSSLRAKIYTSMIYPRTQPRQPFTSESSNFSKIFQVAVAAVAAAADGIITCTVYPEVPPRVEYTLTETGYSRKPILDSMVVCGSAYQEENGTREDKRPAD